MKKLLLLFVLLPLSVSVLAEEKEVNVTETKSTATVPRSIVQKPTATIDTETFTLSVKLLAPTESYTLYVEDSRGNSIYQAPLSTTGVEDLHLLGSLESDTYTLRIENEKRSFEGEFEI